MSSNDNSNSEHACEEWDLDSQDYHRAREEAMTFENWFGVHIADLPEHLQALKPKRQIMVHAQPRCRQMTKSFPATVYMSDEFPMSVRYKWRSLSCDIVCRITHCCVRRVHRFTSSCP